MESGRTLDSLETRSSLQQLATIDPQKHAILQQLDKKKRARTVAVPTDDAKVRICLRAFLQPITLFGEGPYDRRERLKAFLADRGETGVPADFLQEPGVEMEEEEEEEDDNEEFFTHGTEELVEARIWLASYSLPRSKQRLESQQLESQTSLAEAKNKRKSVYLGMKQTGLYGTQICGDRPLSACAIAPDSQTLATGCFGGSVKLWSLPNCTPLDSSYKGNINYRSSVLFTYKSRSPRAYN